MNKIDRVTFIFFCFISFFTLSVQATVTEIPFWHSLSGRLGKTLLLLSDEFNLSQKNFKIRPIYKGTYPELFTNFVAAYKANLHPPLVQIQEISTATMLQEKALILPVYELMQRFPSKNFNNDSFIPSLRYYYGNKKGALYALPFNSSSAVLYYNKTLFDKAGITFKPKTWFDVEKASKILKDKKLSACGFTTSYPSWIHIENFTQWHGISIINKETKHQREVDYHSLALTFHLNQLAKWHKEGIYQYAGRDSNATALFTSAKCAMMIQSSGAFTSLKKESFFNVDVSSLPYWPQYRQKGFNGLIGGAALWVINGFDEQTYQGITQFMIFLTTLKNQAFWQRETGYFSVLAVPINNEKQTLPMLKASQIAFRQISHKPKGLQGLRLPHYYQIRLFNDEQIEAILSGLLTVDEALAQSNQYTNSFLKNNI